MLGKAAVESKTMWLGLIATVLGAIDFTAFDFIPDRYMPAVLGIVGALILAIRPSTHTPVTGVLTPKHEAERKGKGKD